MNKPYPFYRPEYDELDQIMQALLKQLDEQTPEESLAGLKRAGILGEHGDLTRIYGGPDGFDKTYRPPNVFDSARSRSKS